MIAFKPGVRVMGLQTEALIAVIIAHDVYQYYDEDCIITSITDGAHQIGSLHHTGHAFDLRLPQEFLIEIAERLQDRLGRQYDVVTESDHIHVEYDPKRGT